MVGVWYMDDSNDDQRKPHQQVPNKSVPLQDLSKYGVMYHKINTERFEKDDRYLDDPDIIEIRQKHGYSYTDMITVSPDKLPDYDQKIASFFREHMHSDNEIWYIVDGSGYFDVRDEDDKWIRILCEKGDLVSLPAGIYHRFTVDEQNYIKAIRFFVGEPVWAPINLPEADSHAARAEYKQKFFVK